MARPSTSSRATAAAAAKSKGRASKKEESESESEASTEVATSSEEEDSEEEDEGRGKKQVKKVNKGKGGEGRGKRRVVEDDEDEEDDEEDNDNDNEDSQNVKPTSSKSRGAVNNADKIRSSKSSGESQGSSHSSKSSGNGGLQPLQPHGAGAASANGGDGLPRSPFRTVSLNDVNPARRRLSGKFNARMNANDPRRQSLPSSLRKAALTGQQPQPQDGDSSFASSTASPVRPSPYKQASGSGSGGPPNHPLRRTSAGFALIPGGGVGALNAAANALRRNGSNTSNGTGMGDLAANATLPMPAISAEAMNTNYEEWMKMATDNKINSTNTWSFALIDYFHDMSLLRNADNEGSINFQKASVTLDGCVKIWTSRVDSVATETGKLLNGLAGDAAARTANEDESDDEGGEGENGDGTGEGRAKKKKTRAHGSTLADTFDKIKVKDLELEFTVDPLFKKTSADFDEGGAAGLLMNHLGSDSNMRVVFDAGDAKIDDGDPDNEEEEDDGLDDDEKLPNVDISKLKAKFLPSLDLLVGRSICPSLSSFRFSSDPTLLDLSLFNRSHLEASTSSSNGNTPGILDDLTLAGNAGRGAGTQDFFDDGGNDFDDGGGGAGGGYDDDDVGFDGFGGGGDGDHSDPEMDLVEGGGAGFMPQAGGNHLGAVQRFDPRMAPDQREVVIGMGGEEGDQRVFSYFDTALAKNWAGPEHWKMRRTIRRAEKEEEEAANAEAGPKKKREKKQPEWQDFSATLMTDHKKIIATSAASTLLPSAKRKKGAAQEKKQDYTLPDDMHFSSQQLLSLFLKPKASVNMRRRLARAAPRPEGEVDEHYWAAAAATQGGNDLGANDDDDDDEGPALPFDTQFFHDEADTPDFEEDLPMGGDEFEGPVGGGIGGSGSADTARKDAEDEDLLAATQGQMKRARPLYVNYAKRAKRVDVKKLKENIWKELAIEEPSVDNEEVEEDETRNAKKFTSVISGLRETYPPDKMEEISTSFCFICLLHLANEQGLRIQSEGTDEAEPDKAASGSTQTVEDMETTAQFVGGLDRLKIMREVIA